MTSQANARYPKSVGDLTTQLRDGSYLADRGLSTAMYVALTLGRPILLEGEVGVGKTEIAKVLASTFGRQLVRLQCYEGIDTNQALYEWDYARQMLQIRALSENQLSTDDAVDRLFGPKFLLERPLLEAIRGGDRRGRSCGRRIRSVPSRTALRFSDHDSRNRNHQSHDKASSDFDLQSHPRIA